MYYASDHQQKRLIDPWDYLGSKIRALLDKSWAGFFRIFILPGLPVTLLRPYFPQSTGRPTKDLYCVLGVLILQELFDLTDEKTIAELAFNLQWQYALELSEEGDQSRYMCQKTLWNMRQVVMDNGLHEKIFDEVTGQLAQMFKVDVSQQRLDSVHIKSNMRKLGRLRLFGRGIAVFLRDLRRHYPEGIEAVDPQLLERYERPDGSDCFSLVKPTRRQQALEQAAQDLYSLTLTFEAVAEVALMHSFKQLKRILSEQCEIDLSSEEALKIKASKDVPADSLQNPSDDEAGYSGHKGQGYQAQIMESYTEADSAEAKAEALNLIVHVHSEPANESDAAAVSRALDDVEDKGLLPDRLLCDTAYGSDENVLTAEKAGVELVSPPAGQERGEVGLSEFSFDDDGLVERCPAGQKPLKIKVNRGGQSAAFDLEQCAGCPYQGQCPVKKGRKANWLRTTDKQVRLAKRRKDVGSKEFRDKYRFRSGVEATMSELDRVTGLKHLRIRGAKAVAYRVQLKALALNIKRAAAVLAVKLAKGRSTTDILYIFSRILVLWKFLASQIRRSEFGHQFFRDWTSTRLNLST